MRILFFFSRLPEILAAFSLFALMSMTFADVLLRSIWNAPIEEAADITRLLMAIMVFSILPVMSARGKHIHVDLLEGVFARYNLTRIGHVTVDLFCGAILFWPASRVFDLAERSRSYGDRMEYLDIPLYYLGWFIALMTILTALALLGRGLVFLFRPELLKAENG